MMRGRSGQEKRVVPLPRAVVSLRTTTPFQSTARMEVRGLRRSIAASRSHRGETAFGVNRSDAWPCMV